MIGRRFGKLTVVSSAGRDDSRALLWHCVCACSNTKVVQGKRLRSGKTQSCGCLQRERARALAIKHNDYLSLEYNSWVSMIRRCTNPKNRAYPNYGGRGITVCQRWIESYQNFLADMGRRPSPKHSLDRINNSLGYSPGNVRWATRKTQANNSRRNRLITYKDVTRTLSDWSGLTGINSKTIRTRLNRWSWPVGQALGFAKRIHGS